jgi:RNA polymerase sporulation-specific sigma factor
VYENTTEKILNAQNGDQDEMSRLIEKNNGLIWSIVKRFTGRGYELEDLYQIGAMGFIKAIKRFDTSFEVRLSTYAVPYILGEIKRFIRDDGPIKVSRSIKELSIKILELKKEYLNKTGEEISLKQISEILRVPKEEIAMAIESANPVDSIEEASYIDNKTDKSISILDKISTGEDEQVLISNRLTVKKLIEDLQEKDREVILLRFYKNKTQMQVSKILGISQVQVSRIERKILNNMKKALMS